MWVTGEGISMQSCSRSGHWAQARIKGATSEAWLCSTPLARPLVPDVDSEEDEQPEEEEQACTHSDDH